MIPGPVVGDPCVSACPKGKKAKCTSANDIIIDNLYLVGCQGYVGLSRGKAKVCCYSGWYYCTSCHQDNTFIIPARLLHNWDTGKHKVGTNISIALSVEGMGFCCTCKLKVGNQA